MEKETEDKCKDCEAKDLTIIKLQNRLNIIKAQADLNLI
jgi:hypothetical protein